MTLTRRALLGAASAWPLAGCEPPPTYAGGWLGASHTRGHRLRESKSQSKSGGLPAPAVQRRAEVLVIGAGIAGLGCARALAKAGVHDVHLLELEDSPGGNSRAHQMAGMRCPLGAHYLPLPGDEAVEVIELLEELGLCRTEHGRRVYDERHLCHSPQERLFFNGAWHEGLTPIAEASPATLSAFRQFARTVNRLRRELGFAMPSARAPWTAAHQALDAIPFAQWLQREQLHEPLLRQYLDYCCRDDYGAGVDAVSAWAGIHYFASRHGFHSPGDEPDDTHEAVLTWPEGNAWLAERMAAPLRERSHTGRVVWRVDEGRHEVSVDAFDEQAGHTERWVARQVVMATPLFISARLLVNAPEALSTAAAQLPSAPWLVANLHIHRPLLDHRGAPPAWDNVIHGSAWLGYVNAMHQSTRPHAGPTVLTAYWALGDASAQTQAAKRQQLLQSPWALWGERLLNDLAVPHPDLRSKLQRIDLMRYGHAMATPAPGLRGSAALRALATPTGRVHFAHSDLSTYSVFEEAMYQGHRAATQILASR